MTAFFDTNILIYAQGSGAKGDTARAMLLKGGTISVQVLNEFTNVLRKKFRLDWPAVMQAVGDVRELFERIRPIDIATHETAITLASAHGFSIYDSLIVASALNSGCDTLLTEDLRSGQRIDSLIIVNPFRPDTP